LTWFASIHKKLRQGSPCNGRISRIQTDGAGRSTPAACQAESLTAGGGMQPIRRPRRHRPPSPAGPGPPGGGVAPAGAAVRAAPDRQPRARRRCGSHGRRSGNSTGAAARPWPPPRLPAWPLRGGAPPRESCFHGRRRCTSPTTRGRSTARQGRKALDSVGGVLLAWRHRLRTNGEHLGHGPPFRKINAPPDEAGERRTPGGRRPLAVKSLYGPLDGRRRWRVILG
jgi:hypothetical protein